MQNERKKQVGRFFALIQKLNFIFIDESFNEMKKFLQLGANLKTCFHVRN